MLCVLLHSSTRMLVRQLPSSVWVWWGLQVLLPLPQVLVPQVLV